MNPTTLFDHYKNKNQPIMTPYTTNTIKKTINLNPFIYPLQNHPNILKHIQINMITHNTLPHHTTIPITLNNITQNSTHITTLKTHIQHYFTNHNNPNQSTPYNYIIYQNSLNINNNKNTTSSINFHPNSTQQITIPHLNQQKFQTIQQ